ncbi:DUF262 domain-containing protein [Noviherbaspirillum aerium]|uniref:DUF262 domain-containing protein n=1 Tax=Noviherbaspirillum aerium TaxID=2588497 RepID=UPI00124E349F|nr:DUF262 domain-containing protein [Noviherbaspirillum aerium]
MNRVISQVVIDRLADLLQRLQSGSLVLANFARPFVWSPEQVCELLRSMYLGGPVGYMIVQTMAPCSSTTVRVDALETLIDGKQRLLSLMSVLYRAPVLTHRFEKVRFCIAFNPQLKPSVALEVASSATDADPAWVSDVATLFDAHVDLAAVAADYCAANPTCSPEAIVNTFHRLRSMLNNTIAVYNLQPGLPRSEVLDIFYDANRHSRSANQVRKQAKALKEALAQLCAAAD